MFRKMIQSIIMRIFNPKRYKQIQKKKSNFKTGMKGEKDVLNYLSRHGFAESILHDVLVRDDVKGKLAQLDLVIVGRNEVSIIEVKTQNFHTVQGHIDDEHWYLIYGKNSRFKSNNIYAQVKRQESAIKSLMKKHNIRIPIRSYILINSENRVNNEITGLSSTNVKMLQRQSELIELIEDKTKNKLLYNILVEENKRHAYVRKFHAKS